MPFSKCPKCGHTDVLKRSILVSNKNPEYVWPVDESSADRTIYVSIGISELNNGKLKTGEKTSLNHLFQSLSKNFQGEELRQEAGKMFLETSWTLKTPGDKQFSKSKKKENLLHMIPCKEEKIVVKSVIPCDELKQFKLGYILSF